jgi:hypothetical protein
VATSFEPRAKAHDPLAVAVANASLFSAGYVMLGRRRLAASVGLVTLTLVIILAAAVQTVWFEVVVLVWWAAVIGHGWYLAGGRLRRTRRGGVNKQLFVALGITVPVLVAIGFLRFDASRIDRDVAAARGNGDCAQALTAAERRWAGHYVADAPLTAGSDDTVEACERLQNATVKLDTALTGDIEALTAGFNGISAVVAELPGHERMAESALKRFLDALPTKDACDTSAITDWLAGRRASGDVLDRAVDVVPRLAPAALVGCGDDLMATNDWEPARTRYQQLISQYPGHDLATRARKGVSQATLAIQLAKVRDLLRNGYGDAQPAYCSNPAPYGGAAPYGNNGPNRTLPFGNSEYTDKLPAEWKTQDAADAVLVLCAGKTEFGAAVQTCPYESKLSPFGSQDVTFRKIAIPVRVYEVRTGRLVADTKVEISGSSCPKVLKYTTSSFSIDLGPPSEVYVTASDSDIRAAFAPLIDP